MPRESDEPGFYWVPVMGWVTEQMYDEMQRIDGICRQDDETMRQELLRDLGQQQRRIDD